MAQFPSGAAGGGDAPLLQAGAGAAGAAPPPGAGLPRPAPEPGAEGGEAAAAGAGGAGEAAPPGAGLAGAEQQRVTDVSTYVSLSRTVGSSGHLGPPKDPKWPVSSLKNGRSVLIFAYSLGCFRRNATHRSSFFKSIGDRG